MKTAFIIIFVVAIFVVGILFARKNKNKVDSAISDAEKLAKQAKDKVAPGK